MRMATALLVLLFGGIFLSACSSDGPIRCNFKDPAQLSTTSSWPKARRDAGNTGHLPETRLPANLTVRAVFESPSGRALTAAPVLGNNDERLYVGDPAGVLHALDPETLLPLPESEFSFTARGSLAASVLVGARTDGSEVLFVGALDARFHGLTNSGAPLRDVWPVNIVGLPWGAPAIAPDGTLITTATTSFGGLFLGLCPNGVQRFGLSITTAFESDPAVAPDGLVVAGGADRLLRGVAPGGNVRFAVSLAAPLAGAAVIEPGEGEEFTILALDRSGHLLRTTSRGQPLYARAIEGVTLPTSPALAGGRLYFGDTAGRLLAVNIEDASVAWILPLGESLGGGPAVLSVGEARTIVAVTERGVLHVVEDDESLDGPRLSLPLGHPVHTAPTLRRRDDGSAVIYVADDAGRVSRID